MCRQKYVFLNKLFDNYKYINWVIILTKGERGVITMTKRNLCHKVYRIFKSKCENIIMFDLHECL